MIFRNGHHPSPGPKYLFASTVFAAIIASGWLMLADVNEILGSLDPALIKGVLVRRIILMSCLAIYFSRLLVTSFIFVKRRPAWRETIVMSILIPSALFVSVWVGAGQDQPLGIVEVIGIFLYAVGSYLTSCSEYWRHAGEGKTGDKRRPYTRGLIKYSMHIQYLGDVVLFVGLALIARSFSLLFIPLLVAAILFLLLFPRWKNTWGRNTAKCCRKVPCTPDGSFC